VKKARPPSLILRFLIIHFGMTAVPRFAENSCTPQNCRNSFCVLPDLEATLPDDLCLPFSTLNIIGNGNFNREISRNAACTLQLSQLGSCMARVTHLRQDDLVAVLQLRHACDEKNAFGAAKVKLAGLPYASNDLTSHSSS